LFRFRIEEVTTDGLLLNRLCSAIKRNEAFDTVADAGPRFPKALRKSPPASHMIMSQAIYLAKQCNLADRKHHSDRVMLHAFSSHGDRQICELSALDANHLK
jgi:hypothetical protein